MKGMKGLWMMGCLLGLLSGCGRKVEEEQADPIALTHNGTPFRGLWSSFPLELKISSTFESSSVDVIERMSWIWDEETPAPYGQFFSVEELGEEGLHASLNDFASDGVMGIYSMPHWFENERREDGSRKVSPTALGFTQLKSRLTTVGDGKAIWVIEHADIFINAATYNITNLNPGAPGNGARYDLGTIVLHELGHFLGLDHLQEGSVMSEELARGVIRRDLTEADRFAIRDIYQWNPNAGGSSSLLSSSSGGAGPAVGSTVTEIIELLSDGECRHSIDGELVFAHRLELPR